MDRSDVLIIGGGIAGIAAALDLLDAGNSVQLVDRDEEAAFGGLARESFGGMFFVDSPEQRRQGIRDSVDVAFRDWCSFAEFGAEDRWPRAWAEAYVSRATADVYRWVRRYGVSFLPVVNWVERGEFQPGNSVPRFHVAWGTGKGLTEALIEALRGHKNVGRLTLRFDQRVERLTMQGGRIDGAAGHDEKTGAPFEVKAEQVVVAAGGINGSDLTRVRQNWHRDWGTPPETLLSGSHRFADGTLHDATVKTGGVLTHLDKMWNYAAGVHHPRPRKPLHGLSLVPPRSALWLNWRGMRIGPQPLVSGFDTRRLVTEICAQQRQYSWQLMNMKIALKELAISGAEHNPSIRNRNKLGFLRDILFGNRWLVDEMISNCRDFIIASSLPELVEKMNVLQGDDAVELKAVQDAVSHYDATIARGESLMNDEQLRRIAYLRRYRGDRIRLCKFQPIHDAKALPLIAVREFIISRKSLGGIRTDLESRVLDASGEPIAGLYAIGEVAGFGGGGVHGLRALEGTFLGGCIFSGRIAAASIVGRKLF
ncbi:MAG TPA: FAD-binding dehydrogenase [Bradyrhizobium sp.]|uniref:FAD-binding dehydrogenase n=1 Tax=Bradyrhizobium sp. TaxID=376 RepID=UPI002BD80AD9|nr:FAD-binding dehydrogenase [Bradyrhizobium sp.]HLZ03383.1 FAD-binding dehydrogenase [Bradyrhizobium sp.]